MSEANQGVPAPEAPVSGEESAQEVIAGIDAASDEAQSEGHITESVEAQDVQEASDSELEDVIESEEATTEEKQEAVQELSRRLKLKIRGEERELDLGNDDDLELLREMAQKGEGADSKFQEAAQIRKQMEQLAHLLQQDPYEALRRIGHNPDDLMEKYVENKLQEMQLSPEQKRIKELEQKLQAEEEKRKQEESARAENERIRLEQEYAMKVDEDISKALENSSLPRSAYVVDRIVNTMAAAINNGYEDVTVADVVPFVSEKINSEIQEMFSAMPEETLEQLMGKSNLDRLRKRRLKKAKQPVVESTAQIKPTGEAEVKKAKEAAEKEVKPQNSKDFFKSIGSY